MSNQQVLDEIAQLQMRVAIVADQTAATLTTVKTLADTYAEQVQVLSTQLAGVEELQAYLRALAAEAAELAARQSQ